MQTRKFKDGAGVEWTVCCVTPPGGTNSEGEPVDSCPAGWLCFDSRAERRRLAEFPSDWLALREEKLAGLLAKAEQTPRRRLDESTAEFTRRQDQVFGYQPSPKDGSRCFCTPDNQLWSVKECDATNTQGSAGATLVLRFVAGDTVRELESYPDDWARLTTEQLIVLALDARPVTSGSQGRPRREDERGEDERGEDERGEDERAGA